MTTDIAGSITTYTYDSNGNQRTTEDATGITTFTYNYENKLTQITYPDISTNTFTYNGDGKRMGKTDSTGTRKYLYDEQKYDIIIEKDASDVTKALYTLGLGLISQKRDTTYSYYLYDALGSTRNLNSTAETTTDTYSYEAFGNIESSSGTTVNPFKYIGEEGYYADPDSDLILLQARYYAPNIGRFVNTSLAYGWAAQKCLSYVYVANDPVNSVDPEGLMKKRKAKPKPEPKGREECGKCMRATYFPDTGCGACWTYGMACCKKIYYEHYHKWVYLTADIRGVAAISATAPALKLGCFDIVRVTRCDPKTGNAIGPDVTVTIVTTGGLPEADIDLRWADLQVVAAEPGNKSACVILNKIGHGWPAVKRICWNSLHCLRKDHINKPAEECK